MDPKAKKKTQMDERLRDMGVNMDQRRKIIAATRLGIGPLANAKPQRAAENSPPRSLPSVGAASSRAAAAAAAADREKRQREAEAAQKEDDTDLQGFLAGGKATKKAVAADREQRKQVVHRRDGSDLDAFLAGGRASAKAAAVVAQRAPQTQELRAFPMPGLTLTTEVRPAAPAPAASLAPERPGERPFDPEPLPPMLGHRQDEAASEEDGEEDDPRLAFLNEQRSAKRRAKKEEMRKRREERLQQLRDKNANRVDDDDEEDDEELREADESDSSDDQKRIRQRDGKISASKGMDQEMRKFWGESVKGRVSGDYKGFSDAELERRFALQQASSAGQKLMTEAEVLAMMLKGGKRERSRSRKRRR